MNNHHLYSATTYQAITFQKINTVKNNWHNKIFVEYFYKITPDIFKALKF